ncbi:hypothetical protein [uncultured Polaribacter sp.]|uniref:hypothetical protein n=1 Tax=uncultured Polaribacter sp. TaxID=174711 RepID=UPI0026275313|nr:hypothetical protein [uncultured Polaribacter sp.]
MIYDIKFQIEQKCGFVVKTKRDCIVLSDLVYYETSLILNYNTLRRFFGIVRGTEASVSTLNILCIYLGYESYSQFCAKYPLKKSWDSQQRIFNIIYEDPISVLKIIEDNYNNSNNYIELLITLVYGVSIQKKYKSLKFIFNSELLNPKNFSYSQMLYFGNCIGPLLKKSEVDYLKLIKTKYFSILFFNTYIDINSLNGLYGLYALKLYNYTSDKQQKLFINCILEFKNLLNKKDCKIVITSLKFKEIHPILFGRYMSILLFNKNKNKKEKIQHVINFMDQIKYQNNLVDYLYEFTFACIINRDIDILKLIIFETVNFKISKPYYQEYHYSIFKLRNLIVASSNGDDVLESIEDFKKNSFFRNSHKEFIEIIILILEYHNLGKDKSKLKEYQSLAQKLNYPIFDKKYCLNYFNSYLI